MTEKLVRDKIPQIIKDETGSAPDFRVAPISELPGLLINKIIEEANELAEAVENGNARDIDKELADVKTAYDSLMLTLGRKPEQIEEVQSKRDSERGTFTRRIV